MNSDVKARRGKTREKVEKKQPASTFDTGRMPVSYCAPYVLDATPCPYYSIPLHLGTSHKCQKIRNIHIRRTSIDSISHRQPARHPAYYPSTPDTMLRIPCCADLSSLGAYGPILTPSGQALPAPPTEQTARDQTATSDDEHPTAKILKKKRRTGGEDGGSKSSTKKSKRATNVVSEAPTRLS
jgi:hypothetical protein